MARQVAEGQGFHVLAQRHDLVAVGQPAVQDAFEHRAEALSKFGAQGKDMAGRRGLPAQREDVLCCLLEGYARRADHLVEGGQGGEGGGGWVGGCGGGGAGGWGARGRGAGGGGGGGGALGGGGRGGARPGRGPPRAPPHAPARAGSIAVVGAGVSGFVHPSWR